jgi:two-component system nitrate/nitrite response regulator NarL
MGEKVFPTSMAEIISKSSSIWDETQKNNVITSKHLSNRELDILKCLAKGEANKTIANHLSICDSTVKVHLKAILRKLGFHNRTQAALWAVQNNLLGESEGFYFHNSLKPECLTCAANKG